MVIKINLSNKLFFLIITLGILTFLGISVYAAPEVSHTLEELGLPTGCESNAVLTWDGTQWNCNTIDFVDTTWLREDIHRMFNEIDKDTLNNLDCGANQTIRPIATGWACAIKDNNCAWTTSKTCPSGSFVKGTQAGQIYCCGGCVETCWKVDYEYCDIFEQCLEEGVACNNKNGIYKTVEYKINSDCTISRREIIGGECTADCKNCHIKDYTCSISEYFLYGNNPPNCGDCRGQTGSQEYCTHMQIAQPYQKCSMSECKTTYVCSEPKTLTCPPNLVTSLWGKTSSQVLINSKNEVKRVYDIFNPTDVVSSSPDACPAPPTSPVPDANPPAFDFDIGPIEIGESVLCTEANRQGYISDEWLKADSDYANKNLQESTIIGYHSWAKPLVKELIKSPELSKAIIPLSVEWAKHMAYLMGKSDEDSEIGAMLSEVGIPLCNELGKKIMNDGYSLENEYEFNSEIVKEIVTKNIQIFSKEELEKPNSKEIFAKELRQFLQELNEIYDMNQNKL